MAQLTNGSVWRQQQYHYEYHYADDVASLQELLDAAYDRPIVIWHDLAHLVGILAAVAAMDAPDAPRPQHPTGPFPACD